MHLLPIIIQNIDSTVLDLKNIQIEAVRVLHAKNRIFPVGDLNALLCMTPLKAQLSKELDQLVGVLCINERIKGCDLHGVASSNQLFCVGNSMMMDSKGRRLYVSMWL